MNTTNQLEKLKESSQKRDEVRRVWGEYLLTNQQNLPQELITAWGGFERLELEARTIETEAIKAIEPELEKAHSVIIKFTKFDMVHRVFEVLLFSGMLGLTIFLIFYACEPQFMIQKERKVAQKTSIVILWE